MNTRCMIVDDEPLAIEVIAAHIGRIETLVLTASCSDADGAFTLLQKHEIDLLFLDIEMPGLTGIGLLRALRHPPAVIITTAHRNYAVEGFDLDVIDYLLKPVSYERFLQAVQKFQARRVPSSRVVADTGGQQDRESGHLLLRADRKVHKIPLAGILFIESDRDYVKVHTPEQKFTARMTLGAIEELLPADRFLRIHRSLIVAVDKIDAFTSHSIEIGKHELTIGRNYRDAVLQALHADPHTP